MLLFGASLFPFYAGRAGSGVLTRAAARLRSAFRWAAIAAVASGVAWAAASLVAAAGGFGDLIDRDTLASFFFETSFGSVWLFRFALLAALAVASFVADDIGRRNATTACIGLVAALLLITQARIGHPAASTGTEGAFVTAGYAAHVIGAGAWLGGLLPLWLLVRDRTAMEADDQAITFVLRRFSTMGIIAIGFILAGGGINLWARWDFREPLLDSNWGRALLVKITLLVALVTLAMINRLLLTPTPGHDIRARLAKNIVLEQGLGLLILAAAAILGISPPPSG